MTYVTNVRATFISGLMAFWLLYAQDRPSILWLTIEDMSPHLGCYGYADSKTPVLDSLATKGVVYKNACVTAPVCAVCRSGLITGMFAYTQGTQHMRNAATLSPNVKTYPQLMRAAGYYCTNPGQKGDYQGLAQGPEIWDKFYPATDDYTDRPDKSKPFMHVDNGGMGCMHESCNQLKGQTVYDPAKLTSFPPYYPNTPKARAHWAQYYANINGMDKNVDTKLKALQASGEAANTIVFIYSDHGVGLPRAKRWVYESGLRIPLIIYTPPKWQHLMPHSPGTKTDELVSSIDLTATVLHLAGVKLPDFIQARPIMGENLPPARKYIHGHRDRMGERYEIIRSVRDTRYKYIRNYTYWLPHQQFNAYAELNPWSGIMEEIRRVYSEPNPPAEIKWYFESKTIEELYDLQTDPHEMKDLARDPAYRNKLLELRAEHLRWRKESRDLGAIPEGIILERKKAYASEYDYGRAKPEELERAWNLLDSLYLYNADELVALLADKDMAVRYWAAIGLGNLLDPSKKVTDALTFALTDAGGWVSVAAARGLLLLDTSQAALNALKKGLANTNGTIALTAVNFADDLGNRVASIKTEIAAVKEWRGSSDVAKRAIATITEPPFIHTRIVTGCPDPARAGYNPNRTGDDESLCGTTQTIKAMATGVRGFVCRVSGQTLVLELPQTGDYQLQIHSLGGRIVRTHELIGNNKISIKLNSLRGMYVVEITGKKFSTKQKVLLM